MKNFYAEQPVLVTGGTGFIGRHLVDRLLALGAKVRVLVRPASRTPASWTTLELCRGSLEDANSLALACQGAKIVFHAAGYAHAWVDKSPETHASLWRVNVEGTQNLLDAACQAGVARFVFFSSVKAMGEGNSEWVDESWAPPPQTAYGQSKREAERRVMEMSQRHHMHGVNLRLALVYGPGGRGNLERMVTAIRRGIFPPLPELGAKRSMVYVGDVVQAALLAAEHPAAHQKTYIVTGNDSYSSREIYDLIRRELGRPVPQWSVPVSALRALARLCDWAGWLGGRRIGFDSETLDKLLGWGCYHSDRIQTELGYRPSRSLADILPEILRDRGITDKLPS